MGLLPIAAFLLATLPGVLSAQSNDAADDPHPLVDQLNFKGVQNVDLRTLRTSIFTEPTRCRAFFLKPLCVITHNHNFEFRNHLDRDQLRRDVLRIKVFYWLRGFRHTQVDTTVVPHGRGVAVTFNVNEGPPTLIESLALNQTRDILSERTLYRWGLPKQGERIDLTRLDSLHVRARRALWDKGYGNAEVTDSAYPLGHDRVALAVNIHVGPQTRVDTVVVQGNKEVSARTVGRLVGMRKGDLFKRPELLAAQRRLFRSGLFRMTMLEAPDSADSAKVVVVTVREAPMREVLFGGGINTVEFGQAQANLTLYNFHGSARRVDLNAGVGNLFARTLYGKRFFGSASPTGVSGDVDDAFLSPTWRLSATMTQPWFFSTRNSIGLTVFSNRRSVPNIVIDRGTGASATFTRALSRDIPLSFTYRFERARLEAGELYFCVDFGYCRFPTIAALQQTQTLSPLVATLRADRTDDPLQPRKGYTARFNAEYASAATGSNWRYNRIEADVAPYFKLGAATLAVRLHAGRVSGDESTNEALGISDSGISGGLLHPRSRFFGGGARSVRGFAEAQLGPRVLTIDPNKLIALTDTVRGTACSESSVESGTCDPNVAHSNEFTPRPIGGNSLFEGTVEYRFQIMRALGGAVFVDAGRVGASNLGKLLKGASAVTPGVGLRYTSPVGPVRVDLAIRPTRTEDMTVVTQVRDSLGQLHLVELATPKRYNPAEGPHGFLGKLTSRLQLHLYIGEAY
jgi:outer membrane protein assembly factor BamA